VTCSAQFWADADEAQADFAPPGANPHVINAAIEAIERNKRLLRSMIILLFVGFDTGAAGNQHGNSYGPVFLRVGRILLSSVVAEEGLGIHYLFDFYWRRARKHVAVIFCFPGCNYSAESNPRGGKQC
jgi:hypothetical protein